MCSQFDVKLYIYDLSRGIAKQMSPILLGKQINGIWHTGIVAYGNEYYFGSGGIQYCPPCGTILGEPDEIHDLGSTQIPEDVFQQYLIGLSEKEFRPECYNLFEHNCNTFSNELGQFLTGRTIPKCIQELPKDVLNTPFGAIIKPIFDSMSVGPHAENAVPVLPSTSTDPLSLFEPRPTTSEHQATSLDPFKSESTKTMLEQSKEVPVVYDFYEVSSLTSTFKNIIEKEDLTEQEIHQVNEIENTLMSTENSDLTKNHLQLLETLLDRYEHSDEDLILSNIIQTLGLLVLHNNIIQLICQDPVLKPVFKLAHEFPRFRCPEVQCAVIELFTNICSTDLGREIFVAGNVLEDRGSSEGPSVDTKESNAEHHETAVDHRDVVEVTVKSILDGSKELVEKAAGLVYNISMAKVSEESAMECSSAILECLQREDLESGTVYHFLFALKNFMKISPEVVNLASLLGIELSKFLKLSKKVEEICNELEQYLIV